MPKFEVSFIIEGDMVADDVPLNEESLKLGILNTFDVEYGSDYWMNRDIDTIVIDLKIEKVEE